MEAWQIKRDAARTAEVHSKVGGVLEYAAPYAQDRKVALLRGRVKALRDRFPVYYPDTYKHIMALILEIHQAVATAPERIEAAGRARAEDARIAGIRSEAAIKEAIQAAAIQRKEAERDRKAAEALAADVQGCIDEIQCCLDDVGALMGTHGFVRAPNSLRNHIEKLEGPAGLNPEKATALINKAVDLMDALDLSVETKVATMEEKRLAALKREAWKIKNAGNKATGPNTATRTAACDAVDIHLYKVNTMDLRELPGKHKAMVQRSVAFATMGKTEGTRDEATALAAGHLCPSCKGPVNPGKDYWLHPDDDGPCCEHRMDWYPVPYSVDPDKSEEEIIAHRKKIRAGAVTKKPELPAFIPYEDDEGTRTVTLTARRASQYTAASADSLKPILSRHRIMEDVRTVRGQSNTRLAKPNAVLAVPELGEVRVLLVNPNHDLLETVLPREQVLASGDGALLSIPLNKGMTTEDLEHGKLRVKYAIWRNGLLGSEYTLAVNVDVRGLNRFEPDFPGRDDGAEGSRVYALHPVIIRARQGEITTAVLSRDQYAGILDYARVEEKITQAVGDPKRDESTFVLDAGRYVVFDNVDDMDLHWCEDESELRTQMEGTAPLGTLDLDNYSAQKI